MNLNFMGAPGAGKGTQSEFVAERLGIPQISTGDMLRAAVKNKTEMGVKAREFMEKGELVPDEVVIGIIADRIKEDDCKPGFILDGFPRNTEQASALDEIFKKDGIKLDQVIYFNVTDEELARRLLKRAEIERRSDDNPETIKNRLGIFKQKTQPVLDFYEKQGILKRVDANDSVENIKEKVKEALGK